MSFKVQKLERDDNGIEEAAETDILRGNIVLGRRGNEHHYEDRFTVDGIDVDNYVGIPEETYNRTLSRNHLLISENPDWEELVKLNANADYLSTDKGYDIWDLNSTAGSEIEGYNTETGDPIFRVGDTYIHIQPLNHYVGFAGSEDFRSPMGFENNIESMSDNLDSRGFETSTIADATWGEVQKELEHLEKSTFDDSTTVMMYSGHGDGSGSLCLEDQRVRPGELLRNISRIDGNKLLVVDECYAGNFEDYSIPENTAVYMAAGLDTTYGNSRIAGETRTRYAGRLVEELEDEKGRVSMDRIHDAVATVPKVKRNGPRRLGLGADISRTK